MKLLMLIGGLLAFALGARAEFVDVTTLGARNDGSADVSEIINAATQKDSLYLPPGIYRVERPLRLCNPLRGAGHSRIPKVDATRTWLVSAIPDEAGPAGVIAFADNTCATVEDLSILCKGNANGVRLDNCTQGMMLTLRNIGIFGVSTYGIFVEGSGSRPLFADGLTIWGEAKSMKRSVAIRLGGACDCRLTNIEMMGVAVGIESFNGHTYGSNLHIWTGLLGRKADPDAWWHQTRSLVLGKGSNFAGSQIYPDTSYYAIEFREPGDTCEISNLMYWEDGSVSGVKRREGAFLKPDKAGEGRLLVHGGLVGVAGSDARPGAMRHVYSPRQMMSGVMMKSDYRICPQNLDRLCLGGDLPDYTVTYETNAWCKVADVLTVADTGSCSANLRRDDGAAWRLEVVKTGPGQVETKVTDLNSLCPKDAVKVSVAGDHVKVFLHPRDGSSAWSARFTTLGMGDYCRPIDHGSLRDHKGRVRYREYDGS